MYFDYSKLKSLFFTLFCAVLAGFPGVLEAQNPAEDKRAYTLLNPTPDHLLRNLSADRPDTTESPATVDAGRLQVEMSFFDFERDRQDGRTTNTWNFAATNLKLGLTHNVDLQFVFDALTYERVGGGGAPVTETTGFGDVQVRVKVNLWGNDPAEGEDTAFGVMGFVKIPTGTDLSNDHVEGGWMFMLGWDGGESWSLGFMAQIDAVYDEAEDDYDAEFLHTAALGFDIAGPLGGFVEYAGVVSSDADVDYRAWVNTGMTWTCLRNLQLDAGVRVGLTRQTEDVGVFVGMTWRH